MGAYKRQVVSLRGNAVNEDVVRLGEGWGFVIDGSSGLFGSHITPDETDARWFANFVADRLELALDSSRELGEILNDICAEANGAYKNFTKKAGASLEPGAMPSASIAVFRLAGDCLELFSLGDCATVVGFENSEAELVFDPSVSKLDGAAVAAMVEQAKTRCVSVLEAAPLVAGLLKQNRRLKNTPGGYWILDPSAAGVAYATQLCWDLGALTDIAMMTDGFYSAAGPLGLFDSPKQLAGAMASAELAPLAQRIFECYRGDPALDRFPRLKQFDDLSALYYKF